MITTIVDWVFFDACFFKLNLTGASISCSSLINMMVFLHYSFIIFGGGSISLGLSLNGMTPLLGGGDHCQASGGTGWCQAPKVGGNCSASPGGGDCYTEFKAQQLIDLQVQVTRPINVYH